MELRISISNRQKAVKVPTGIRLLVRRCCSAVLTMEKFEGAAEVSVSFVDNEQIRQLNREFRDKDAATDVLSFPLGENGVYDYNNETGAYMLGDIVISVPRAIEQAQMYGHSRAGEIRFFDPFIRCCTCWAMTTKAAASRRFACVRRKSWC